MEGRVCFSVETSVLGRWMVGFPKYHQVLPPHDFLETLHPMPPTTRKDPAVFRIFGSFTSKSILTEILRRTSVRMSGKFFMVS